MTTPPQLAEWLLQRMLRSPNREFILGDLAEQFDHRRARNRVRAQLWYWMQVLMWIPPMIVRARVGGSGHREHRGSSLLDAIVQTLRMASRGVRRQPVVAAVIVVTFGLGIGANVTTFRIVDRLLLSPPDHVLDAQDVRRLWLRRADFRGEIREDSWFSYPDFRDMKNVEAFASVAAFGLASERTMGRGEDAMRVRIMRTSAELFPLLGVTPVIGRFFLPSDDRPSAQPTAVLTHTFWMSRFNGASDALGQTLEIGEADYTIIGVAPRGFTGPELKAVDVFLAFAPNATAEMGSEWTDDRGWWWLQMVARLAPGATPEVAEVEATAAIRNARAGTSVDAPETALKNRSLIAADAPNVPGEVAISQWLAAVSLLVFVIACANVANLLLTRGIRRHRELATCIALGMSQRRMLAQLIAEGLVLASLGGAAALLVASWGGRLAHAYLLPGVAFPNNVVDTRPLVFTALAVVAATVMSSVVPAILTSRRDPMSGLHVAGGGKYIASRWRRSLLATQVSLSVVLLVASGLFVESLRRALDTDLGFDPSTVVLIRLELDGDPTRERQTELYTRAEEIVRVMPNVSGVALQTSGPFLGSIGLRLYADGARPDAVSDQGTVRLDVEGPFFSAVGRDWFEVMGMDLRVGRTFAQSDMSISAPRTAVVNDEMAWQLWPGRDAVGRCLRIREPDAPCSTVIGVVANHAHRDLTTHFPMYYVPVQQTVLWGQSVTSMVVRTARPDAPILQGIRTALEALGPSVRYVNLRYYSEFVAPHLRGWRLGSTMLTTFAGLALLVATVGVYSTLAFNVENRRFEIGVRAALGATTGRVIGDVLREALATTAVGLFVGLGISMVAQRAIQDLLYEVQGTDPTIYLFAAVTIGAVTVCAAALPGRRAARVPPSQALRAG